MNNWENHAASNIVVDIGDITLKNVVSVDRLESRFIVRFISTSVTN